MPTFAVGVVGDQVPDGHPQKLGVEGFVLEEREVVLLEVGLDEALEGTGPEGSVEPQHRLGDEVPTESGRQFVCRHLPLEETLGEVPQGPLPPVRFVDRPEAAAVDGPTDPRQIGPVGTPGHPPLDLHLAGEEGCQHTHAAARCGGARHHAAGGRFPLVFGHVCPRGSSG